MSRRLPDVSPHDPEGTILLRISLLALTAVTLVMASCTVQVQPFPDLAQTLDPGSGVQPDSNPEGDQDILTGDTATDPSSDGIAWDPGQPDPGVGQDIASSDGFARDPAGSDPAPADPGRDSGAGDPGEDLRPDGLFVDVADPDACGTLTCGLWCEFGFAQNEQGCPICACRECAEDKHCENHFPSCPKTQCSATGSCLCDCSTVRLLPYFCPDDTTVPYCTCAPETGITCLPHPEWQCPTLCEPGSEDRLPCPNGSSEPWCRCEQDLDCVPECQPFQPGSATGYWQNPCTQEVLRQDPPCVVGIPPICTSIGTRSEGWYDPLGLIGFSQCGPKRHCIRPAISCVGDKCTTLDQPGLYRCRDGQQVPFCFCDVSEEKCQPECKLKGLTWSWFDPCRNVWLSSINCEGCRAQCQFIGTRSEGWYSSCGGDLIAYALCGTGTWTCPTETPWEQCTSLPPN